MKKNLLLVTASLLAIGIAAPASAADLRTPAPMYSKAPPMVAAIYDWSGLYIGINGGAGSAHTCGQTVGAGYADLGCQNATGGTIGGQLGYRWQASNWVFGLEAQGNWAQFSNNRTDILDPTVSDTTKIDGFGLFTGQIGYAWDNVLWYAKGGGAVVNSKYELNTPNGVIASANDTRWGGTVGTGVEIGFAPNWSVGVEYNHVFLAGKDVALTGTNYDGDARRMKSDIDMGLVRLNYKFGGPVVARY